MVTQRIYPPITWLTLQLSDIEDTKADVEPTQVSAVHDEEALAAADERAHRSWIYRVWVRFRKLLEANCAQTVDHIMVPDHPGLGCCFLHSRDVQRDERYRRWRKR